MWAAALLLSAATPTTPVHTAICANNSVFAINADESMAIDQVGVEHASYSVTTALGIVHISDSGIFAKWKKGRWMKTTAGRRVLRRHDRDGFHYAMFDEDTLAKKPVVTVSGTGLRGDKADFALLDRIVIMSDGKAEKDPRCAQILHYGWENLLGK